MDLLSHAGLGRASSTGGCLFGLNPPHLVFTDKTLPDGTWADVLAAAAKARVPVNVIVVARFPDMGLYVEVIENGVFDFLAPPFVASDVAHVVQCALGNVVSRRHGHAHAA